MGGGYRSTECPRHRQFQPLVQRSPQCAQVSPSWLGCSTVICTSGGRICSWSVCTVVYNVCTWKTNADRASWINKACSTGAEAGVSAWTQSANKNTNRSHAGHRDRTFQRGSDRKSRGDCLSSTLLSPVLAPALTPAAEHPHAPVCVSPVQAARGTHSYPAYAQQFGVALATGHGPLLSDKNTRPPVA